MMEISGRRRLRMGTNGRSARSDKKIVHSRPILTRSSIDTQAVKTLRIAYEFHGYWEETVLYEGNNYCKIEIEGGGHIQQVGAPGLPQEGVYVNLPEGAKFKKLRILSCQEESVKLTCPVLPNPQPALEGQPLNYRKDDEIYTSEELFPGAVAVFSAMRRVEGIHVGHILVNPIRYSPVKQELQVVKSMILEIDYELSDELDALPANRGDRFRGHSVDILGLPQTDGLFSNDSNCEGIAKIESLQDEDNGAELLIITKRSLKPAFDRFIRTKSRNYKVALIDTEQIGVEFGSIQKLDERIRELLCFAVERWRIPPRYVILGGNITDIPTHWEKFLGARISSDHYYADLKGDLCPDLIVSRFPASAAEEMEALCEHFIQYTRIDKSWGRGVLLTSYNRKDYNACTDEVAEMIASDFQVYKRYDGQASKMEVIETINRGVGFINYRGHGVPTGWQADNGLTSDDLKELKNTGKIPQVLSIACSNNALEAEHCFGCEWIRQGKAVSFLGAAVPSYTVVNHELDKCLWEGIVYKGLKCAGEIFNYGIQKLYMDNPDNELVKHTIYAYLLVGDPTAAYDVFVPE